VGNLKKLRGEIRIMRRTYDGSGILSRKEKGKEEVRDVNTDLFFFVFFHSLK
jgi:hypothetical protein